MLNPIFASRPPRYWNAGGRTGLNVVAETGHSAGAYNASIRRKVRNGPVALTNIITRHAGWFWDGGSTGETNLGHDFLLRMSIEYPIGTAPRQITLRGDANIIVPNGQTIQTDPIGGLVIPAGAEYYYHMFVSNTIGATNYEGWPKGRTYVFFYAGGGNGSADKHEIGASVTDQTGTIGGQSTTPDTAPNNLYQPLIIAGTPVASDFSKPTFAFFGDSIGFGFDEDSSQRTCDSKWNVGPWERWVGGVGAYGYVNASRSSVKVQDYCKLGTSNLLKIWGGVKDTFTHAIVGLGVNDKNAGRTSAQIQADLAQLVSFLVANRKKVWVSTLPPYTSSSDNYVTTANQTVDSGTEAVRLAVNAAIIAGIPGASGDVNLAAQFSDSIATDKWRCDGGVAYASQVTGAGLHPKTNANIAAASGLPAPSTVFA